MVRKMKASEAFRARHDGMTIDESECSAHSTPPQEKTKLEEELSKAYAEFQASMHAVFGNDTSWQRTAASVVIGLAAAVGVGTWIMGLTIAASALTTSAFLGFCIIALGFVVAMIVSGVAGEILARGIMTRKFEDIAIRGYYATRSFVSKLFNKEESQHA